MELKTLGYRLRALREERGLLQREVGAALDISDRTIGNYEADDRKPDPEMLKKLARFYSVSTDFLIYGFEPIRLSDVVLFLKGKRTDEEFANNTGVDEKELWRMMAEVIVEQPPLEIIKKIYNGSPSAPPEAYDDLLIAAGYKKRQEIKSTTYTLAASRTDGYDDDLPEEAIKQINDYIELIKFKYKKKDSDDK